MATSTEEKIKELFTEKLSLDKKIETYKELGEILSGAIDKRKLDLSSELDDLKEFQGTIYN
ncbi:MAG TPA: hypothetical protein VIY47_17085 [Ignavibacteriaceae bacterium]